MSDDLRTVPLQVGSDADDGAAVEKARSIEEYNSKVITYDNDHDTFLLGFTRYQFIVLLSSWFGWGFDIFDAFLVRQLSFC
jgi:hypothetical protein